ncbi:MAG: hypothetical protein RR396_03535 [Clostridiales bacterium]
MRKFSSYKGHKSSLFFLELIIVIFFFIICALICSSVLLKAYMLSKDSHDLISAVNQAQSAGEYFEASLENTIELADIFTVSQGNEDLFMLYYDQKWQKTDQSLAKYALSLQVREKDDFALADIQVEDLGSQDRIYGLQLKKYWP